MQITRVYSFDKCRLMQADDIAIFMKYIYLNVCKSLCIYIPEREREERREGSGREEGRGRGERERGREGEGKRGREGQTDTDIDVRNIHWLPSAHAPTGDRPCNLSMSCDWELNETMLQSTEPHW